MAGLSSVSLPCLACFADLKNCEQLPDEEFELIHRDAPWCTQWFAKQELTLAEKGSALVDELGAGNITIEEYSKQSDINFALRDASEQLMNACPYASCEAQNRLCTGIAGGQTDGFLV